MEELFLGRVLHSTKSWARLEPLAELFEGRWRMLENGREDFPPDGKIFAPSPDFRDARKDSLWVFSRRLNERPEAGNDQYLVDASARATPIVDLSDVTVEEARQAIFDKGIRLPHPDNTFAVVLIAGEVFCGLEFHEVEQSLFTATPSSVPTLLMAAPLAWKALTPVAGFSYLPARVLLPTHVVRRVNWCSDQDFVARVLNRFRKQAQQHNDSKYVGPTKEGISYVGRVLEQGGVLPGTGDEVEFDLERLRAQWPALEAKLAASEEFYTAIIQSPVAQAAIQSAATRATADETSRLRAELEVQIRNEVEASLASMTSRRDDLFREVEDLKRHQELLRRDVSALEGGAQDARERLSESESKLRERASELREAFEGVSPQELPFARAVVERLESVLHGERHIGPWLLPPSQAPWAIPDAEIVQLVDISGLEARLEQEGKAHGVEPLDLLMVDTLVRAGEFVLLLGDHGERAIAAYARCVSGGTAYSMGLDPTTLGLDDLWRVPGSQLPTTLAHAWTRAVSMPDRAVVICLRNFDAAPFHLWLSALYQLLRSSLRPRNLLFLGTTTSMQESDRPDYPLCDVLHRWLVPVCPRSHPDGSLTVLSSLSAGKPQATTLRSSEPTIDGNSLSVEWVRTLTTLGAGPDVVVRAAHIAPILESMEGGEVASSSLAWLEYMCTAKLETLPACLRDGYGALPRLNYQR